MRNRLMLVLLLCALLLSLPAAASEDTVYIATLSGTKFHVDRDCWGLQTALIIRDVDMDQAYAHGYTPCKVCAEYLISPDDAHADKPSFADGVLLVSDPAYAAANGCLYHDKPDCLNLWYADEIITDRALYFIEDAMSHCPLCVLEYPDGEVYTDNVVFTSLTDDYYHATPVCPDLAYSSKYPIYEIHEVNLPTSRDMCPTCYPQNLR